MTHGWGEKGNFEQQKGGHLRPSLQELLNKPRRGLMVLMLPPTLHLDAASFSWEALSVTGVELCEWFGSVKHSDSVAKRRSALSQVFSIALIPGSLPLSSAPNELMLAETSYTLTERRTLSAVVPFWCPSTPQHGWYKIYFIFFPAFTQTCSLCTHTKKLSVLYLKHLCNKPGLIWSHPKKKPFKNSDSVLFSPT